MQDGKITKQGLKAVEKAIEEFNNRTKAVPGLQKAKDRIRKN